MRTDDLLEPGERLLHRAPRWRGVGAYLREFPWVLVLVVLVAVHGGVRVVTHGFDPRRYGALDVALVLAAGFYAAQLLLLRSTEYFVTDRRVGSAFPGGAWWRPIGADPATTPRGDRVVLDFGTGPTHERVLDVAATRERRLRFVVGHDDAAAILAALAEARRLGTPPRGDVPPAIP